MEDDDEEWFEKENVCDNLHDFPNHSRKKGGGGGGGVTCVFFNSSNPIHASAREHGLTLEYSEGFTGHANTLKRKREDERESSSQNKKGGRYEKEVCTGAHMK